MLLDGEEHKRCPRLPLYNQPREFGYWLALYRDYQKGIMPEAGGRLDQSAYVLQVFAILDGAYAQVEEAQMEEAKKGGKKGRPGGKG